MKDEELVERLKKGNIWAFEELIKRYKRRIYAIILSIVRDRDESEDLVQEVFLKVYEGIGKFRGKSSFYTWLYRIAVNVALSYLKKAKRELEFREEIKDPQHFKDIEEDLIKEEFVDSIFKEANTLPKKEKLVFILKFHNDLSNSEIAEVLGISKDSVKANLYHALKRIRKKLKQKGLLPEVG